MSEQCTIYLLRNKLNNQIYIGQTWLTLKQRFGTAGENYNNSPYLYHAICKYGAENFEYDEPALAICNDQETADAYEAYYIELFNTRNLSIGYNLKEGGAHGRHSAETIAKISATWRAKADAMSDEERKEKAVSISSWWNGKERGPHSEEWKENNSTMMKGWH